MKDLFGNEKIRTLGFYQPYATLMLHGKIESRWVQTGKKPPFPLGKYLIYSTKKFYPIETFNELATEELATKALRLFRDELPEQKTAHLHGFAIGIGDMVEVCKMPATWLDDAYYWPPVEEFDGKEGEPISIDGHTLWALRFSEVKAIIPFLFKGKQGVGFFPEEEKYKIQLL